MTIATTLAVALQGIRGSLIEVESVVTNQLPRFSLIGLPDTSLAESRERVLAACASSGCEVSARRITTNLSPASIPKHGASFDLAIALSVLGASGALDRELLRDTVFIGELGLDGRVREVTGVLPRVLAARLAGVDRVVLPEGSMAEASLVQGVVLEAATSLRELAVRFGARPKTGVRTVAVQQRPARPHAGETGAPVGAEASGQCLSDVVGNADTVYALQCAAAGGHHLLMVGPPGAGKTMLAERLPMILPRLTDDEALEVLSVCSIAGETNPGALRGIRPFQAPHHTVSPAGMVGGGSGQIRPGAAALANHGVLFLDEAPEFSSAALETLRQPIERGRILIHRAHGTTEFPSAFQLIMAANPCPCGNAGSLERACECSALSRRRYFARLSGPLLDRIDIQVRVQRAAAAALAAAADSTQRRATSSEVRERIAAAREVAGARWSGIEPVAPRLNARVPGAALRGPFRLAAKATEPLDRSLDRGGITMRGYDRILRLSWSIADLEGKTVPDAAAVRQAMYLRSADLV